MPFNPFAGKTEAELLVMRAAAQADFSAGKTVSDAGAGDVTMGSQVQMTPIQRLDWIFKALNIIDPVRYPASSYVRVTRTHFAAC